MIDSKYFSLIMQARNLADVTVTIAELANISEVADAASSIYLQEAERSLDKSFNILCRIKTYQRKAILNK